MGFLSDEEHSFLKEPIIWKEATQKIIGATSSKKEDLIWAISSRTKFPDNEEKDRLIAGLNWGKNPIHSDGSRHLLHSNFHSI
jgi:saccharopine dehydrogenase (NADP+, L-glutamate forming)